MSIATCKVTPEILAAITAGDLVDGDERLGHLARCEACQRALVGPLLDRVPPDEDLVALGLLGAVSSVESLAVEAALARESRLRARRDALAQSQTPAVEPARRSSGASVRWWLPIAVAAVFLCALPGLWALWDRPHLERAPGEGVKGGAPVEVWVEIAGRVCPPGDPCSWRPATEELQLFYRSDRRAQGRFLALVATDTHGERMALYPRPGDQPWRAAPASPTEARKDALCREGRCWLDGGLYEGLAPGRLVISAWLGPGSLDERWLRGTITPPGAEEVIRVTLDVRL